MDDSNRKAVLFDERGPVLTDKTTLDDMIRAGADRLADVPLTELLEFVRNQCLQVCADVESCEEMGWEEDFAGAATAIQQAIEHINHGLTKDPPEDG